MADLPDNRTKDSLDLQQRRNAQTRASWEGYASHRHQVMRLLLEAALSHSASSQKPRLLLLGAGNCNDLDLAVLLTAYSEVHLVDWDAEALQLAVQRQQVASQSLHLHPGVNLMPPIPSSVLGALPQVEVVASICLISQLLEGAMGAARDSVAQVNDLGGLSLKIVQNHLQDLFRLTANGGRVLLVTDIVSSDTLPALLTIEEAKLAPLLGEALQAGNFFAGLHPGKLQAMFQNLDLTNGANLPSQVAKNAVPPSVRVLGPWKWLVGPRAFGVVAFAIDRPVR